MKGMTYKMGAIIDTETRRELTSSEVYRRYQESQRNLAESYMRLVLALEKVENPTLIGHVETDPYTQKCCIQNVAHEALLKEKKVIDHFKQVDELRANEAADTAMLCEHIPRMDLEEAKKKFTCHGCSERYFCRFSWDGYNLDGDCLASK